MICATIHVANEAIGKGGHSERNTVWNMHLQSWVSGPLSMVGKSGTTV